MYMYFLGGDDALCYPVGRALAVDLCVCIVHICMRVYTHIQIYTRVYIQICIFVYLCVCVIRDTMIHSSTLSGQPLQVIYTGILYKCICVNICIYMCGYIFMNIYGDPCVYIVHMYVYLYIYVCVYMYGYV